MRQWVVGFIALVLAMVGWLAGARGLETLAIVGWPVIPAALIAAFTKMRPSRAMFIGGAIGLVPAGLLALSSFATHRPDDPETTRLGTFVLLMVFLALPNVFFGAFGGLVGLLLRNPGPQAYNNGVRPNPTHEHSHGAPAVVAGLQ